MYEAGENQKPLHTWKGSCSARMDRRGWMECAVGMMFLRGLGLRYGVALGECIF